MNTLELIPVSWEVLSLYMSKMRAIPTVDVDKEVLYLNQLTCQGHDYYVVQSEDVLLGFVIHQPVSKHLTAVFIDPRFRGLGLGTKVLEMLVIHSLYVMPANTRAFKLYERCGFVHMPSMDLPTRRYMFRAP